MSTTALHRDELHTAIVDMTGSVAVVEAAFIPWDDDQATELEAVLRSLHGLDRLDREVFGEDA